MQFQQFVGKTVKSVDESCVNCVKIVFTDGTETELFAGCGGGPFNIPFFEVQVADVVSTNIRENMSNAENWKVGDIIEATTQGYNNRLGVRYEVIQVNSEEIRYKCLEDGYCSEEFVDKDELGWLSANYKFIYRPVVN